MNINLVELLALQKKSLIYQIDWVDYFKMHFKNVQGYVFSFRYLLNDKYIKHKPTQKTLHLYGKTELRSVIYVNLVHGQSGFVKVTHSFPI